MYSGTPLYVLRNIPFFAIFGPFCWVFECKKQVINNMLLVLCNGGGGVSWVMVRGGKKRF